MGVGKEARWGRGKWQAINNLGYRMEIFIYASFGDGVTAPSSTKGGRFRCRGFKGLRYWS